MGNGSQTDFTITHLLVTTPQVVNVRQKNLASKQVGGHYESADSTDITVHFIDAPGNGVSMDFWWDARVSP